MGSPTEGPIRRLIREIHRRSLWQVLGIYLVASWAVLSVVDTLGGALNLPDWFPAFAFALLVVGLPIVLATAFVQEGIGGGGPEGKGPDTAVASTKQVTGGVKSHLTWRKALLGGAVAFSLLSGVVGLFVIFGDRRASSTANETDDGVEPAIAVLPFTVRGEGLEMWREGMVDLLSPMIDGVAGLRAISNRTVLARWSERTDVGEADLAASLAVARAAGARYALVGSAVSSGATVRLDLDLYNAETGVRLARGRIEGRSDDLMGLTDRAAAETVRSLLESQGRIPDPDLERLTDSPEALVAFLEGEVAFRGYQLADAWDAYQEAVEVDTAFALAHFRLTEVGRWGVMANRPTGPHLEAAGRHQERLNERIAFTVRAGLASGAEAQRMYREGIARYPDDATLSEALGEALIHSSRGFPTFDEIEAAFLRAVELEPDRPSFYPHVVSLAFDTGVDTAGTRELVRQFNDLAGDLEGPYTVDLDPRVGPFAFDLVFGTPSERAVALAAVDTLPPDFLMSAGQFTYHPRLWDSFELVQLAAWNHNQASTTEVYRLAHSTAGRRLFVGYALWRGQWRRALEFLDAGSLGIGPSARLLLFYAYWLGLPVSEELLDREFGPAAIDSTSSPELVTVAGALAADRGRWEDHDRAISELRRRSATTRARQLEAYGTWRRGDLATAISEFEQTHFGNRLVQWWLGDAYIEAGRWEEAERVFRSYSWNDWYTPFTREPLVQQRLGTIYEALGRPDEAAAAYAYFLEHWENADPELQPLKAAVRLRLEEILAQLR